MADDDEITPEDIQGETDEGGDGGDTAQIHMVAVLGSSNVSAAGYSTTSGILLVEFDGGKTYRWDGVAQEDYDGLLIASSPGGYIHRIIEQNYGKGTAI